MLDSDLESAQASSVSSSIMCLLLKFRITFIRKASTEPVHISYRTLTFPELEQLCDLVSTEVILIEGVI